MSSSDPYSSTRCRALLDGSERVSDGVLVGVVPEVLDDEAVLGELVGEGLEHGIARGKLPVRLQFTAEREHRDQFGSGTCHAGHGGLGLVVVPRPAGVDDGEDLVAVVEHRQGGHGTARPDSDPCDDDVGTSGRTEQLLKGTAEARVLIAVDDPGAAVDGILGEDLLQLGEGVPVLPLGIRRAHQHRYTEGFGHLGEGNDVRLVGG